MELENIRPTGKPLSLEDKNHCSVVMTTDTMKVKVMGKFRQRERKLFILLIHSVWDEIGEKRMHTVEVSKIKQVFREITGVQSFNSWLWEYLENLAKIEIQYSNNHLKGITRLFSDVCFDEKKEFVTFEIPKRVEASIKQPNEFARLDTYFLIGLKGKYSVSLYQLLESKINLKKLDPNHAPLEKNRFIEVKIEELKSWLGVNNQYKQWKDFKKRVLLPAIEEINSNPLASTFTVKTEEVTGARRKVIAIKFFLTKTPERLIKEKEIKTAKKEKKPNYLDKTLDNYSQAIPEYEVVEIVNRWASGNDHKLLLNQWRNKAAQSKKYQGKGSFVNYCKKIGHHKDNQKTGFISSLLSKISNSE